MNLGLITIQSVSGKEQLRLFASRLARALKEGKKLGRPKGRKPSRYKLTGKGGVIRRARLEGKSKSEIARNLGVMWVTLDRYMKKISLV